MGEREKDMYLTCVKCGKSSFFNHIDVIRYQWFGRKLWRDVFNKYYTLYSLDDDVSTIDKITINRDGRDTKRKMKVYKGKYLCYDCNK